MCQNIGSTQRPQIVCQAIEITVSEAQVLHIKHRFGETSMQQRVTQIMHVDKLMNVLMIVDTTPGCPKFPQGIRSQSGQHDSAARYENPRDLIQCDDRFTPRENQIGKNQIEGVRFKGQAHRITHDC